MERRSQVAAATLAIALALSGPGPTLFAQASGQRNRSRAYGPGRCGPADPVYLKTARETGGQPFFLSPDEIPQSAGIIRESSAADSTHILWATDGNGEGEFTLPIDASVTRLTLSASFDGTGGQLTIVSPDGNPVSGDGRIEDAVLNCVRIVTVPSPQPGAWRIKAAPSSRFWLVAHARSELDIVSAEFVRIGGRPGHEGLFKITGRPVASAPATLRVRVTGPNVRTVEFMSMSMDGRLLGPLNLRRSDDEEFIGSIDLPSEAFRVAMTGVDSAGHPYQRINAAALRGELVELAPADAVALLVPGHETRLRFRVRNLGPRARYRMVATTGAQVLRVAPAFVDIDEGAEALITVWVQVAPTIAPGTAVEVMVTASGDDARETMNYAVRQLTVAQR